MVDSERERECDRDQHGNEHVERRFESTPVGLEDLEDEIQKQQCEDDPEGAQRERQR
jgi:hypothetical protein